MAKPVSGVSDLGPRVEALGKSLGNLAEKMRPHETRKFLFNSPVEADKPLRVASEDPISYFS